MGVSYTYKSPSWAVAPVGWPHHTTVGQPIVGESVSCRVANYSHVDRKGERELAWREEIVKRESGRPSASPGS